MLKIGEFANIFNISIKTVRFYEEKGLFKPFYIDKYSGYRYYDEKNIEEMSKILYLKDLDFSLEEIKNYDENRIKEKIEEYKSKIFKLNKNIDILNELNLKNKKGEEMISFVNDENAIGKWNLIGISNTKEEAEKHIFENNLFFKIKELYLMENGRKYWIISWSKNYIYINGNKNPYDIKDNLMFVEILYPDESTYIVAVYEKENNNRYNIDDIRKKDKFNGFFKEDNKLIGFWNTVDFIKKGQNFNYKFKKSQKEFLLERLTVNPIDNSVIIYSKNKKPRLSKYTKKYIFDLEELDTVCKYEYKRINGNEYIFVEWKDSDYVFNNTLNGYYVLEKVGGNYNMENVFENKEKMYSILSKEKCGLVLGKDIYLPSDKRGNNNVLVVAGSGAGKSAAYTVPNILNMLGSYIVTDPWGEIYEKTHNYLENNGYMIKTINYDESKDNYKYNPLNHVEDDFDIDTLTDILVGNDDEDEFWNESCKCLMKAILYYVIEKEEKKDLLTCFKLMSLSKDELFKKLDEMPKDSKISKYYSILKTFPEKTYSSVVSTTIMKLAFVINSIPENRDYSEKFDFNEISKRKIAIFLICKENRKEDKKYINIFISQLLSKLKIDDDRSEKIYFLLDEVDKFGNIYELPRNIEIARARKISISMMTGNLSKLEKIYKDDFGLMINNIDTQLLLGTKLKLDIDYFSDLLGLDNEFIRDDLGNDKLLVYEKGLKPIIADKSYFFEVDEWRNI